MLSAITLEQWRIFHAVAEHGGYAQAARALHKSHSSLHHALAKMQDSLGLTLIEVEGRAIRLTPEGQVLLRRSARLLENAEELQRTAASLAKGWETELTLAIEIVFPTSCLYTALKAFYPQSRGCRLRIRSTVLSATQRCITEGTADLVITGHVPQGYLGTPVAQMELLPVARADHPLVQGGAGPGGEVMQHDLAGHLQIVISEQTEGPGINQGWLKAEQRWTVDNFAMAQDCLYQGLGFCWLPRHLVAADLESGRLAEIPIEAAGAKKVWLYLVVPSLETLGPAAGLLRELFLKHSACARELERGA